MKRVTPRREILHSGRIFEIHVIAPDGPVAAPCPSDVRDEARAASLLERIGARRVALQRPREHAVQDRGDAEHVEDHVELPVRDARCARCAGNTQRRTRARSECRAPRNRSPCSPRNCPGAMRQAITDRRNRPAGGRASRAPSRAPRARAAPSDGRSRCRGGNRRGRSPFRRPAGTCCGSHAISRSIAGMRSAAAASYCFDQRAICRSMYCPTLPKSARPTAA